MNPTLRLDTGVPQGCVIGPVLFVIYTASLHYMLDSLIVSFHFHADDTQVYVTVDDFPESKKITHIYIYIFIYIYIAVSQCMKAKKLKLKPGKTEILLGTAHRINLVNEPFSL